MQPLTTGTADVALRDILGTLQALREEERAIEDRIHRILAGLMPPLPRRVRGLRRQPIGAH